MPDINPANRVKLSKNFFLDEFTTSQTAVRYGIDNSVEIGSRQYRYLKRLCEHVLQPIRDALGPVHISSGFRCQALNKKIGGASTSQHIDGLAADITVTGYTPYQVATWCKKNLRTYDQLIHEYGEWVHVSINPNFRSARKECLTAVKRPAKFRKPKTEYVPGIHLIAALAV